MADIIDFGSYMEEPDMDSMDKTTLLAYLETLRAQISELDAAEPEDMDSEAYEEWGQRHEDLEDLMDEVMDRLEEF